MVISRTREILGDPETKGFIMGIVSSITSSIVTLYVVQHYMVQKAANEAAKRAITSYRQEYGIMSTKNWKPLTDNEIRQITSY